jgi:hypothetical protein
MLHSNGLTGCTLSFAFAHIGTYVMHVNKIVGYDLNLISTDFV